MELLLFKNEICICLLIHLWPRWVSVAARASLWLPSVQAPPRCGAQALIAVASVARSMGPSVQARWLWPAALVAPRRVGSSRTGGQSPVPCTGRRVLYYWTTREVLNEIIFKIQTLDGNEKSCFEWGSKETAHS